MTVAQDTFQQAMCKKIECNIEHLVILARHNIASNKYHHFFSVIAQTITVLRCYPQVC